MSLGIEVRGEDLTVALQAEKLTSSSQALWDLVPCTGQCSGKDGKIPGELVGFELGWGGGQSGTLSCSCPVLQGQPA